MRNSTQQKPDEEEDFPTFNVTKHSPDLGLLNIVGTLGTRFKINHTINYVLGEKKNEKLDYKHIFIRPSTTKKSIAMNIKEDIPLPNFIWNERFCSIESSIVGETYIHGSM